MSSGSITDKYPSINPKCEDVYLPLLFSIAKESMSISELVECGVRQLKITLEHEDQELSAKEVLPVLNDVRRLLEDAGRLEILLQYKLKGVHSILELPDITCSDVVLHKDNAIEITDDKTIPTINTADQDDNNGYKQAEQYDRENVQQNNQQHDQENVQQNNQQHDQENVQQDEQQHEQQHDQQDEQQDVQQVAHQHEQENVQQHYQEDGNALYSNNVSTTQIHGNPYIDNSTSDIENRPSDIENKPSVVENKNISFQCRGAGIISERFNPASGSIATINTRLSTEIRNTNYLLYCARRGDVMYIFKALPESIKVQYNTEEKSNMLVVTSIGQITQKVRSRKDTNCIGGMELYIIYKDNEYTIDNFSIVVSADRNSVFNHRSGIVTAKESSFIRE